MFKLNRDDRSPTWYPDAPAIRDRWGTQIGPNFGGKEFRAKAGSPDGVLNHMRWSLGLM